MKNQPSTRFGTRVLHAALVSAGLLLTAGLTACSTPQGVASTAVQPFDQAAAQAADGLAAQLRTLPTFLDVLAPKRVLMVDSMIETGSSQRTKATELLQTLVVERLRGAHGGTFDVVPFSSANLEKADYVLTGTTTRQVGVANGVLTINLSLVELGNRKVVAQASAVAAERGVDNTPLQLDQDSPVLAQDEVLDGYASTAGTPPGQPAAAGYIDRISVAPVIEEAAKLYNSGRYADALARYQAAGAAPGGDQLRVLSGIYLSLAKLGRSADAQRAFRDIVAYGVENKQLGVKFLFTPGSTAFWADPAVSGPYAMWMGQIAGVSTQANVCMNIVGHTSRTGTQAYNDELSLQRAKVIQGKLAAQSAVLQQRTRTSGRGFRDNIIGTGSDDVVDSLDRRVEFKIIDCS